MRIYIVEDDLSVINILEDIIEAQGLGEICGDCGGERQTLPTFCGQSLMLSSSTFSCR